MICTDVERSLNVYLSAKLDFVESKKGKKPLSVHVFTFRSTLCSVMAQLTEDVQPSFDTTLKSKAVSENCNAKFTCVVSGRSANIILFYVCHCFVLGFFCLFLGVTETFQIVCDVTRQEDQSENKGRILPWNC